MEFWCEISFKTTNSTHVCRHSRSTNLLVHIVDTLSFDEHVGKTSNCSRVHSCYSITNKVVANSCQFHQDNTHIIYTFWDFYTDKFLNCHVPSKVVDGCRTVIHTVCKSRNLSKISSFRNLFESSVNITNRLLCVKNSFPIHR